MQRFCGLFLLGFLLIATFAPADSSILGSKDDDKDGNKVSSREEVIDSYKGKAIAKGNADGKETSSDDSGEINLIDFWAGFGINPADLDDGQNKTKKDKREPKPENKADQELNDEIYNSSEPSTSTTEDIASTNESGSTDDEVTTEATTVTVPLTSTSTTAGPETTTTDFDSTAAPTTTDSSSSESSTVTATTTTQESTTETTTSEATSTTSEETSTTSSGSTESTAETTESTTIRQTTTDITTEEASTSSDSLGDTTETDSVSEEATTPTGSTGSDSTTTSPQPTESTSTEKPKNPVGSSCDLNEQCINFATCQNRVCRCDQFSVSANRGQECRRMINSACDRSSDCVYNAECTENKICKCKEDDGFQVTNNATRCGVQVGGKCNPGDLEAQCIENAECTTDTSSPNYFCRCLNGFSLEDGVCSGSMQFLSSFTLCIIALIFTIRMK